MPLLPWHSYTSRVPTIPPLKKKWTAHVDELNTFVSKAKPKVSTHSPRQDREYPSRIFRHVGFNREQHMQIEYENRVLLAHLARTWDPNRPANVGRRGGDTVSKSLHSDMNKRQTKEVEQENARMLARLNKTKPCIGSVRSTRDTVSHFQLLSRMTKQDPDYYIYKADAAKKKKLKKLRRDKDGKVETRDEGVGTETDKPTTAEMSQASSPRSKKHQ